MAASTERQQVIVLQQQPAMQQTMLQSPGPGFGNQGCGNILICIVDGTVMLWITVMGFVAVAEVANSALDLMSAQVWMSVTWAIFSVFVIHVLVHLLSWVCCPYNEMPKQGCCRRFDYPIIFQLIALGGWVTDAAFLTNFYIYFDNLRPASHFESFNVLLYVFIIVSLFTVTPFWYQTWKNCLCCAGLTAHGSGDCVKGCCGGGNNCCLPMDGRGVYAAPGAFAQGQMVTMQVAGQ